ncbi:MAG: FAD-binding protein [Victivallales bacterium]|nr:FAD-binding protein [Victivallales bacterium]
MDKVKYRTLTPEIAAELKRIVGDAYVIYGDKERLEVFSHDEIPGTEYRGMPEAVVRPDSAAQISAIMKLANLEKIPVTPRGAGSGLSGGAVPVSGGIVLCLDRMNRILDIDVENMMVEVEPGVVTNEINEALRKHKLFYAGYPMSLETCFIGGNVAENAGGGKAVKYGVTSRYVLGLEVVTPTGEIVELGGKLVKDVTGYNMVQLMVGSEGTLGIFTRIVLKLIPLPEFQVDLLCMFRNTEEAVGAVPRLMTVSGIIPASIEYMNRIAVKGACEYLNESIPYEDCGAMLLVSLDGTDQERLADEYEAVGLLCREHGAYEVYVADNPSISERLWRIRRNIGEAFNVFSKRQSGEDMVVPPASLPAMVAGLERIAERYGISVPCFGHAGDGNVHARLVCPPEWSDDKWNSELPMILDECYRDVAALGGRISGEHGIGCKRKKYMDKVVSPEYISMLRAVKKAFDPNWIMNPGKIFDL